MLSITKLKLASRKLAITSVLLSGMIPSAFAVHQNPEIVSQTAREEICSVLSSFKGVEVMEGQFTQEKILPVLSKPLLSSGNFISIKGYGLIWEVKKPVSSKILFVPGVLKQYTSNGVQEIKATGTAYDGMGILLPAIFDGDLKLLSEYFEVIGQSKDEDWELQLKPRNPKLAELVQSVVIEGKADKLSKATMKGAANDITHISFTNVHISHKSPTQDQLAWFL